MIENPIAEALARCTTLPIATITTLFERYGRPLEDAAPLLDPVVVLADGSRVGRLKFRAPVDVIENDHFVMTRIGSEPRAMPGPLFAAAIAALTRKNAQP